MKQPFRYCRGEFTRGAYLKSLVICPNLAVQDVVDELVYQACFYGRISWMRRLMTGRRMPPFRAVKLFAFHGV